MSNFKKCAFKDHSYIGCLRKQKWFFCMSLLMIQLTMFEHLGYLDNFQLQLVTYLHDSLFQLHKFSDGEGAAGQEGLTVALVSWIHSSIPLSPEIQRLWENIYKKLFILQNDTTFTVFIWKPLTSLPYSSQENTSLILVNLCLFSTGTKNRAVYPLQIKRPESTELTQNNFLFFSWEVCVRIVDLWHKGVDALFHN